MLSENILVDRTMASEDKMAWMPILGESVFRFDESEAARQLAMPCLSFENPKRREELVDTSSLERKSPVFLPQLQLKKDQQEVVFQVSSC